MYNCLIFFKVRSWQLRDRRIILLNLLISMSYLVLKSDLSWVDLIPFNRSWCPERLARGKGKAIQGSISTQICSDLLHDNQDVDVGTIHRLLVTPGNKFKTGWDGGTEGAGGDSEKVESRSSEWNPRRIFVSQVLIPKTKGSRWSFQKKENKLQLYPTNVYWISLLSNLLIKAGKTSSPGGKM